MDGTQNLSIEQPPEQQQQKHQIDETAQLEDNATINCQTTDNLNSITAIVDCDLNNDNQQDLNVMLNESCVHFTNKPMPLSTAPTTTTIITTNGIQCDATETKAFQIAEDVHVKCVQAEQALRAEYEVHMEQLRLMLKQNQNTIALLQRERNLLEKEKQTYCKEMELAKKEKEAIVIKFAMQEKLVIDAKKDKEIIEKQLLEAKRNIENSKVQLQAANEEKMRQASVIDRKCQEMQKQLRECEKLKIEHNQLESKLKYANNKLNMEVEAKHALEKKLEENPSKLEEKVHEKLKMEYAAKSILLTHELERKAELLNNLNRDLKNATDENQMLKKQLQKATNENTTMFAEIQHLKEEHDSVQSAYSDELLNAAKLRGQLEELQLLKTQNMLHEEKVEEFEKIRNDLNDRLEYAKEELRSTQEKQQELLDLNREMSETITTLQNENSLMTNRLLGIETEIEILRKQKSEDVAKLIELEQKLQNEENAKNHDRNILARHLSEKTKLYELTKMKLEDLMGDFEASKNKHNTILKELKRELQKYKKLYEKYEAESCAKSCTASEPTSTSTTESNATPQHRAENQQIVGNLHKRQDSQCSDRSTNSANSSACSSSVSVKRHENEEQKSEMLAKTADTALKHHDIRGVTKKHLVERILRLQQLSARQAEKIDFLENHTLSLVSELQKKSRLMQYYMLRDQAGALTSSKSDQNKEELSRYGNGVMSAIYMGARADIKTGMTLDLSLEINKKLQAVLEDTLLKNITLKENVDVLGLEVDSLTKKLRTLEKINTN